MLVAAVTMRATVLIRVTFFAVPPVFGEEAPYQINQANNQNNGKQHDVHNCFILLLHEKSAYAINNQREKCPFQPWVDTALGKVQAFITYCLQQFFHLEVSCG